MYTEKKCLENMIELLRFQLHNMDLRDKDKDGQITDIVALSQLLDEFIVAYMKEKDNFQMPQVSFRSNCTKAQKSKEEV